MELHSQVLLDSLKAMKKETGITFEEFFKKRESEIKFLIKQRWQFGRKPDGSLIGHYSNVKYAEDKYRLNPKAGKFNVDLIDHSDLVDAIKIIVQKRNVKIISSDEKFALISKKYGIENFNITEEEQEEIINEVSAETLDYLYEKYVL